MKNFNSYRKGQTYKEATKYNVFGAVKDKSATKSQ